MYISGNLTQQEYLRVLDFSCNRIQILQQRTFYKLPHLQKLIMINNRIKHLSCEILAHTLEISHLDFSHMRLPNVPAYQGIKPMIYTFSVI